MMMKEEEEEQALSSVVNLDLQDLEELDIQKYV